MHEISCPHHHDIGRRNSQLNCVLCGSCQCCGVGEAKEETHRHQSGGGSLLTFCTCWGTLGGTPHCTEHLEITITSLLSLLPSALTKGRVLEHSCPWDLGWNSQMCDFLFLWLHCWLIKGNIVMEGVFHEKSAERLLEARKVPRVPEHQRYVLDTVC